MFKEIRELVPAASGWMIGPLMYLMCERTKPRKTLELGCGFGYTSLHIAYWTTYNTGRHVALDNNAERLDQLNNHAKQLNLDLMTVKFDAHNLCVKNVESTYDLCHVDLPFELSIKCVRLVSDYIQPGGILGINHWKGCLIEPSGPGWCKIIQAYRPKPHKNYLTIWQKED